MRRFLRSLAVLGGAALIIAYGLAYGDAGTVTVTEQTHQSVKLVLFDCTVAAAADSIDATTTSYYDGEIVGVTIVPNASYLPSDNYDLCLYDANSLDVFFANGANLDSSTTYNYAHGVDKHMGMLSSSQLRLNIDNADSSSCALCAKIKVYVWIR